MKKFDWSRRAAVAAIPLLLLGCAGEEAEEGVVLEEPEMAEVAEPMMAEGPRVEITAPAEGATVQGDSILVTLVTHDAIVEPADARQTPGRGHHHIFIDEDVTAPGAPIPPTSETIIHMGNGAEEFVIPTLAPGPHRVIAVFAFGDHVPNTEVAQDTVNFTVAAQ